MVDRSGTRHGRDARRDGGVKHIAEAYRATAAERTARTRWPIKSPSCASQGWSSEGPPPFHHASVTVHLPSRRREQALA
jgi:hypothetical protein